MPLETLAHVHLGCQLNADTGRDRLTPCVPLSRLVTGVGEFRPSSESLPQGRKLLLVRELQLLLTSQLTPTPFCRFQLVTGRTWRGTAFGGVKGRTEIPGLVEGQPKRFWALSLNSHRPLA